MTAAWPSSPPPRQNPAVWRPSRPACVSTAASRTSTRPTSAPPSAATPAQAPSASCLPANSNRINQRSAVCPVKQTAERFFILFIPVPCGWHPRISLFRFSIISIQSVHLLNYMWHIESFHQRFNDFLSHVSHFLTYGFIWNCRGRCVISVFFETITNRSALISKVEKIVERGTALLPWMEKIQSYRVYHPVVP